IVAVGGLSRSVVANFNAAGDVTNDNSAANWIAGGAQATQAQAGLSVLINKKLARILWDPPQHLFGALDAVPQSVQQYGVQIVDGNGTVWINPDSETTPYPTQTTLYESIVAKTKEKVHGWVQGDLPAQFLNNGFKVAVRAYNFVNGVLTAGPWTQ